MTDIYEEVEAERKANYRQSMVNELQNFQRKALVAQDAMEIMEAQMTALDNHVEMFTASAPASEAEMHARYFRDNVQRQLEATEKFMNACILGAKNMQSFIDEWDASNV